MPRKTCFTLIVLCGILLSAACSRKQTSQTPEAKLPGLTSVATASPASTSPAPAPQPATLRVVYFKAGHVMLWTEGEGTRPLVEASFEQVRISDDGLVVAFLGYNSAGVYGLYALNTDGTGQRLLVGGEYLQNIPSAETIVAFDFAPASHMLYFVTDQYDLGRVEADRGTPAAVFAPGKGGLFTFSPDGRWIALSHPDELLIAHPDGSGARLAFKNPPDSGYTLLGPEINWVPDSSGFYFVSASGSAQDGPDNMTVWFVPLAGDPIEEMTYTGPFGANLSPDGRTVVYLYEQHDPVDVHIVSPEGKDTMYNSYSASSTFVKFMGWAPDSQHFLLDLSHDGRVSVPYLCSLGEQPVKLTDTDNAGTVNWVDVQRLLFVSHGSPAGDELRLQRLGEPSVVVDGVDAAWYDYTTLNP